MPGAGRPVALEESRDDRSRGARALVLDRTFGTLFWGKLLSSAGVWMQGVTAAIVVYEGTGSATAVSLITLAQALPQLVLGPWSGVLADRGHPARQILLGRMLCVLGSGLLAAFFATVDPGPHLMVGVVFACSLLVGTGFVIGGPAMQSIIPDLVRPSELHTAMTLNTAPLTTARIAGPALGAFVLGWAGPAASFAVSAGTHAVFVLLLVLVARIPRRSEGDRGTAVSMRAGLTYLRAHPRLWVMLGATALLGIGTEPSLTLAPALSESLHGDVLLAGPLTLSFGIGSLAGLLGTPVLRRWASVGQAAWIGLLTMIVGMGLVAALNSPVWAFACFGVAGAGFSWGMAGFSSLLQSETDRGFRGRVMAWWFVAFLGFRPLSASATGLITDLLSVRAAFAVSSAILAICAGLLGLALWRRSPPTRFH